MRQSRAALHKPTCSLGTWFALLTLITATQGRYRGESARPACPGRQPRLLVLRHGGRELVVIFRHKLDIGWVFYLLGG